MVVHWCSQVKLLLGKTMTITNIHNHTHTHSINNRILKMMNCVDRKYIPIKLLLYSHLSFNSISNSPFLCFSFCVCVELYHRKHLKCTHNSGVGLGWCLVCIFNNAVPENTEKKQASSQIKLRRNKRSGKKIHITETNISFVITLCEC